MELLPGEIKLKEFGNGRSRIVISNYRIYKELLSWRKRIEFFSIPLERLDGIEKHLLSKPMLLFFGAIVAAAGGLLYTDKPDGALGLLILGGIFFLYYLFTRQYGIAIYAGKTTIHFRAKHTELESLISVIETARWERVNQLGGFKYTLPPTMPQPRIQEDKQEDKDNKTISVN